MKQSTDREFTVVCRLASRLARARRAVIGDLNRGLTPMGVSAAEASALLAIRDAAVATASVVAHRLDLDSGFITRLLDRLEKRDLITRVRKAEDRRVIQLVLTDGAKAILTGGVECSAPGWSRRLSSLTNEEWQELLRLLAKLAPG